MAIVLAIVVVAIWGVTFISTKILIINSLQPAWIFTFRFMMAYAGLWAVTLLTKGRKMVSGFNLRDELIFLLLGITGGSIYFLAENTAVAFTNTSNVSFLVCTAPLITALMTMGVKKLFKGEIVDGLEDVRATGSFVVGTLLSLAGMALIVFDGSQPRLSVKGDLLAIAAALCWGAYSIFMSQMAEKYGTLTATRKVFFYGLVTILPFLHPSGLDTAVLLKPEVAGNLLFLGIVASLLCYVAWNKVMVVLGNVSSTNYIYLNPLFTLLAAILILGEQVTLMSAAGSATILAGVYLAEKKS